MKYFTEHHKHISGALPFDPFENTELILPQPPEKERSPEERVSHYIGVAKKLKDISNSVNREWDDDYAGKTYHINSWDGQPQASIRVDDSNNEAADSAAYELATFYADAPKMILEMADYIVHIQTILGKLVDSATKLEESHRLMDEMYCSVFGDPNKDGN